MSFETRRPDLVGRRARSARGPPLRARSPQSSGSALRMRGSWSRPALVLAAACSIYAVGHFRLNSDINALLPTNVEWRRHELAFESAFRRFDLLEAVVEAPTPELAAAATSELAHTLEADKARFELGRQRRRLRASSSATGFSSCRPRS